MEKQNKIRLTAAVLPISNQEDKTFPNQDSQKSSKESIKDSSERILKTKQINQEQPVVSETHFSKNVFAKENLRIIQNATQTAVIPKKLLIL